MMTDRDIRNGMAEARAEGKAVAQLEIARKMKGKYPVEDISEMTGLSVEEVNQL